MFSGSLDKDSRPIAVAVIAHNVTTGVILAINNKWNLVRGNFCFNIFLYKQSFYLKEITLFQILQEML